MKLFEMEGFLRGKCLPGDMKVNETNAEYLVRKFAEADARCAALAAENAGVKAGAIKAIEDIQCFYDSEAWHVSEDGESETAVVALDDAKGSVEHFVLNVKTPATDAFLAEVRAQGVDAAIEHLHKKFDRTGHIGVPVMALEWLAQELRKGGAA
ncbi:TPA: hypothetical protein OT524_004575 [Enterobacter hormaechei]|nr:hypothetical protein [Enterobacter hormaechei]